MFKNKKDIKKKLINIDQTEVPLFSFKGSYIAKVVDVYDGDTITVCFFRNKECIKVKCRMYGYDSPEMRPNKNLENREEIKKAALEAKMYLFNLLKECNNIVKIECLDFDKYGRVLTNVYKTDDESVSFNSKMIDAGHGKPYFGGKK